uniref:Uncharacterized protein n=1 Tax=Arundo donax TaxID=35708 RepID=A0A0A9F3Z6_ARUDO
MFAGFEGSVLLRPSLSDCARRRRRSRVGGEEENEGGSHGERGVAVLDGGGGRRGMRSSVSLNRGPGCGGGPRVGGNG